MSKGISMFWMLSWSKKDIKGNAWKVSINDNFTFKINPKNDKGQLYKVKQVANLNYLKVYPVYLYSISK